MRRLLLILLLAGCATPDRPKLATEVVTLPPMQVPVPIPCAVGIPTRPPTALPPPTADIARKAAGASADVRALNQHADQLEAALLACGAKP